MTEMHPVVTLLLARTESHPHEFSGAYDGYGSKGPHTRWEEWLRQIKNYSTPEEQAALDSAVREIRMMQIHHEVMQELLR